MSITDGGPTEAPLRRLDWRFLLPGVPGPAFERVVLLGGTPGLVDLLRETGLGRDVATTLPDRGGADLIAVLDGAPYEPDRLAGALAAGGLLYAEHHPYGAFAGNRRPLRPAAALRKAGLQVLGRYAVLPEPAAAKAFVPLGARAPADWLAHSLVPASTPLRRALRAFLALPGGRLLHRGLGACPTQALVAGRPPLRSALSGALARAAERADPGRDAPDVLLLCDGGNRVVLLPFPNGSTRPVAVIKVPKLPALAGRTFDEQKSLRRIRGSVPARLLATLPEPRGMREVGGVTVAVESFVTGTPMLTSSGGWRARRSVRERDLNAAAGWLADFHASAALEHGTWDDEQRARWLAGPLADYRARFGAGPVEERGLDELGRRARALAGRPFPVVWWHRDYNVWNVFRDGGQVRVIDWEGARPGPPLCDLLHFCTHWHETVSGLEDEEDRLVAFRALFLEDARAASRRSRDAAAVDRALADYLRRLGLDPGFFPVLLAFTWIELALRRDDQLRDQGVVPIDPQAANRNVPYVEAIARWLTAAPAGQAAGSVGYAAAASPPIRVSVGAPSPSASRQLPGGSAPTRADLHAAGPSYAALPSRPLLKASVIVASRNRPGMLADAVRSILAGDALPAELIVIDQSDAPNADLQTLDLRSGCELRYVRSAGRGLSRANNLGVELAHHEILVFTHDDVLATPGWLPALVAAAQAEGGRAVVTGRILARVEGRAGGYAPTLRTSTEAEAWTGPVLYDVLEPLNMAMTRSALAAVGGFDVRLGPGTPFPGAEDADLGHRLLAAGCRIAYHPEALLYHRAWRADADFLPVRWSYGLALGAFYAKHMRWRDPHIPRRIAKDVLRRARRFPGRVVRERGRALGDPLFVAGNVVGALRWMRLHGREDRP